MLTNNTSYIETKTKTMISRRKNRTYTIEFIDRNEIVAQMPSIEAVADAIGCSRQTIYTNCDEDGNMTYKKKKYKIITVVG
jgi:AraC-like DNA-binding protein